MEIPLSLRGNTKTVPYISKCPRHFSTSSTFHSSLPIAAMSEVVILDLSTASSRSAGQVLRRQQPLQSSKAHKAHRKLSIETRGRAKQFADNIAGSNLV